MHYGPYSELKMWTDDGNCEFFPRCQMKHHCKNENVEKNKLSRHMMQEIFMFCQLLTTLVDFTKVCKFRQIFQELTSHPTSVTRSSFCPQNGWRMAPALWKYGNPVDMDVAVVYRVSIKENKSVVVSTQK